MAEFGLDVGEASSMRRLFSGLVKSTKGSLTKEEGEETEVGGMRFAVAITWSILARAGWISSPLWGIGGVQSR